MSDTTLLDREGDRARIASFFSTDHKNACWITAAGSGVGKSVLSRMADQELVDHVFAFHECPEGQPTDEFRTELVAAIINAFEVKVQSEKSGKVSKAIGRAADAAAATSDAIITGGLATAGLTGYRAVAGVFSKDEISTALNQLKKIQKKSGFTGTILVLSNIQDLTYSHLRVISELRGQFDFGLIAEYTHQQREKTPIQVVRKELEPPFGEVNIHKLRPLKWQWVEQLLRRSSLDKAILQDYYRDKSYNLFLTVQHNFVEDVEDVSFTRETVVESPLLLRLKHSSPLITQALIVIASHGGWVTEPFFIEVFKRVSGEPAAQIRDIVSFMESQKLIRAGIHNHVPSFRAYHDSIASELLNAPTARALSLVAYREWHSLYERVFADNDFSQYTELECTLKALQFSAILGESADFFHYVDRLEDLTFRSRVRGSLMYIEEELDRLLSTSNQDMRSDVFQKIVVLALRTENFDTIKRMLGKIPKDSDAHLYVRMLINLAEEKFSACLEKSRRLLKKVDASDPLNRAQIFYIRYAEAISLFHLSQFENAKKKYLSLRGDVESQSAILRALVYRASVNFLGYNETTSLLEDASKIFEADGRSHERVQSEIALTTQLIRLGQLEAAEHQTEKTLSEISRASRYYSNALNHKLLVAAWLHQDFETAERGFEELRYVLPDDYSHYVLTSNLFVARNMLLKRNDERLTEEMHTLLSERPLVLPTHAALVLFNLKGYYARLGNKAMVDSIDSQWRDLKLDFSPLWKTMRGEMDPTIDTQFYAQFDYMFAFLPHYEIPLIDHDFRLEIS